MRLIFVSNRVAQGQGQEVKAQALNMQLYKNIVSDINHERTI